MSKPPFCKCVYVLVCVSLPPAAEGSQAVCVVLFLDSSQLSKKICFWLQGNSGAGTGALVEVSLILLFFFFLFPYEQLKEMKFKIGNASMCLGGALGAMGRG